ncbi:MAG: hypothetical protein HOZ81_47160 [Streptomyces sp.]|nr:hypothetical protein [Streptomyces sp.]
MTWPAALPVAALRVLRTAAGRRALQVALVVGGLFALGFLCGERAYAADGLPVDSGTSSVASPHSSAASVESAHSAPASAPSYSVPSSASAASGSVGADERSVTDPAGTAVQAAGKSGQQAPAEPGPHNPAKSGPHTWPNLGAHDDNEAPAPADPVTSASPATPAPPANPAHPAPPATPAAPTTPRSPATPTIPQSPAALIQGVGDRVIAPVVTVVESVTAGLAEAPPLSGLPSLPALPLLPAAPESPSWPSLPGFEVPGLPELPGAPALPTLPGGPAQILPAPVTATSQPGSEAPASGGIREDGSRTGAAAPVTYGPRFVADAAVPNAWVSGGAHRLVPPGYTPVHQAPVEQPGGVAGNRSAGDNGASRHGDAHAVSLSRRDMSLLVPGASAATDADEIQDRHGDIPVSPA